MPAQNVGTQSNYPEAEMQAFHAYHYPAPSSILADKPKKRSAPEDKVLDANFDGPTPSNLRSITKSLLKFSCEAEAQISENAAKIEKHLEGMLSNYPSVLTEAPTQIEELRLLITKLKQEGAGLNPALKCTSEVELKLWLKTAPSELQIFDGLLTFKALKMNSWRSKVLSDAVETLEKPCKTRFETLSNLHQFRLTDEGELPEKVELQTGDWCGFYDETLVNQLEEWEGFLKDCWTRYQLHPQELKILQAVTEHLIPISMEILDLIEGSGTQKKSLPISISRLMGIVQTIQDAPLRSVEDLEKTLETEKKESADAKAKAIEAEKVARKVKLEARIQLLRDFTSLKQSEEVLQWAQKANVSDLVEICEFLGKLNDGRRQRLSLILQSLSAETLLKVVRQVSPQRQPKLSAAIERIQKADPKWAQNIGMAIHKEVEKFINKSDQFYAELSLVSIGRLTSTHIMQLKKGELVCDQFICSLTKIGAFIKDKKSPLHTLIGEELVKLYGVRTLLSQHEDYHPDNIYYKLKVKAYEGEEMDSPDIFGKAGSWGLNDIKDLKKAGLITSSFSAKTATTATMWKMAQENLNNRGIHTPSDLANKRIYNLDTLIYYIKSQI